tara:strand:+ start:49 stop:489 length:441 start_codon:yes stop_codon:yes gene_type:complete
MDFSTSALNFAKTFNFDFDACRKGATLLGLNWNGFETIEMIEVRNLCELSKKVEAIRNGDSVLLARVLDFNDGNSERTIDLFSTSEGFMFSEVGSYHNCNNLATRKEADQILIKAAKDFKAAKEKNPENYEVDSLRFEQYLFTPSE